MEKKEPDSTKRLDAQAAQKVSGDKLKQDLKIKIGIERSWRRRSSSCSRTPSSSCKWRSRAMRCVTGAKRDVLQDAIALIKKSITDFPIKHGNYRDCTFLRWCGM